MADKSIKIQVKLTDKDMLGFFNQHTYTHFSGIVGPVFGIVALILAIWCITTEDYGYAVILAVFTYLFLISPPFAMRKKAKEQIKNVPLFQKPFNYELNDKGIRIFQGKQNQEATWEQVYRVVGNKNAIYIYTNTKNAWIIPNEAMGDNRENVIQFLRDRVDKKKVKIKA